MEGMGIWIFLLLFYLLQAIIKSQQKKRRMQAQQDGSKPKPKNKSIEDLFNRSIGKQPEQQEEDEHADSTPKKPQEPVSLEDLFNPTKLRDILGVPQRESAVESEPEPIPLEVETDNVVKSDVRKQHSGRQAMNEVIVEKPEIPEMRETGSRVASADITDVDESAADFKAGRLTKSDITSDRFDERKEAPGAKKPQFALEYFDEPEDVRNAIVLKEILDKPRAFRRRIR